MQGAVSEADMRLVCIPNITSECIPCIPTFKSVYHVCVFYFTPLACIMHVARVHATPEFLVLHFLSFPLPEAHQTPCARRANIWPRPGYGGALVRRACTERPSPGEATLMFARYTPDTIPDPSASLGPPRPGDCPVLQLAARTFFGHILWSGNNKPENVLRNPK